MRDRYGRTIDYMRISITDRCNLSCHYCIPDAACVAPADDLLTYENICEIVRAAVDLGITKFKITGGEPLVRKDCPSLIGMIKAIPGVSQVTMTTNGILLAKSMDALLANGLDAVNISLDTLRPGRFKQITGRDGFGAVMDGLNAAVKAAAVKAAAVNTETGKAAAEKAAAVKAETVKTAAGKAETGKAAAVKAETGKAAAVKAETVKSAAGKAETGIAAAKKAGTEKAAAIKAADKSPRYVPVLEKNGIDDGRRNPQREGFRVKINTVLQKGINEDEWEELVLLAKDMPVDVRFIELMPIGAAGRYDPVGNDQIFLELRKKYPGLKKDEEPHGNGPAVYVKIPGFTGTVGFISALHGKFCGRCNRIRLTARGRLRPCLCYGDEVDLRPVFFEKDQAIRAERIEEALMEGILGKPREHSFETRHEAAGEGGMVSIGG